ncbi:MAG: DUF2752 domain-containing protein [Actinobacteria bacterium]|nr:DUF2752 domain-containing protein [Actinomycetota bacterium]
MNVWTACPVQVLFGVECPLCGGLRAWNDVLTGNFAAALSENKLAALLAVCTPIVILVWAIVNRRITRRPIRVQTGKDIVMSRRPPTCTT